MKIMSVDDSRMIRKIIRGAVDMIGHDFLEAANGQEALDLLEENYRDTGLILLDWNMPVLDGISTLRKLKADDRLSSIPVMMLTTEAEKERIAEAMEAGAEHYMAKPFTPEDLMIEIMNCLDDAA